MNRSLTPIVELDRLLLELNENAKSLPQLGKKSDVTHELNSSLGLFNDLLSSFDDQLESLRLEANLLQSEDSPFTQRRRIREDERAKRLAEARALAEAQYERLNREKELEALKAQHLADKAEAAQKKALQSQLQEQIKQNQLQVMDEKLNEDWDPSIEYTIHHSVETSNIPKPNPLDDEDLLTISPDDSIFTDLPSTPPIRFDEQQNKLTPLEEIKQSLPPKDRKQMTIPPVAQPIPTTGISAAQLISLLKGILPAIPRYEEVHQQFIGSGWGSVPTISLLPWEVREEIRWQELNPQQIEKDLDGLTSLSLAPRAFNPITPVVQRTISLRLQPKDTTENPQLSDQEEFDLTDFDEQQDPELYQMNETYRALEEQVEEISAKELDFDDRFMQPEPSFDNPHFEPSLDGPFPKSDLSEVDAFDDGPDYTTLDPDLPSIADPFEVLEDLSFDAERLTSDFDWEGDTPTNVFGDEPTPTNIFGDASQPGDQERDPDASISQGNRGLFSRFFGRNK